MERPRAATVLIAHSDPEWQHLAETWAGTDGWRLVPAATGAAALARLREERADLLVLALELSDMHGLELLQRLQQDPQLFDVPAVVVADVDVPTALEYGAEAARTPEGAAERARRLLAGAPRAGVLLVEDDPSARPALGRVIRRAGYACLTADDARQGLEFARARKPDLIITDYQMPGMNGLSFLRELRNDPTLKEVPAIVLTGHVTSRLSRQFGGLSARLLAKPVESTALLAEIRQLI